MGLSKHTIGEFVIPYSQKCGIPTLSPEEVSGINIDKEFFEPAKQVGNDTSNYKVVPPGYFACNLMHVGRDEVLPLALNRSEHNKYVSPAYMVFSIKDEDVILKDYFCILVKSSEKDRYFWFHTDSSVRQGLSWDDFCNIEITLPDKDIQQKYVAVYLSLLNNYDLYRSRVEDLQLVCDGYIEKLQKTLTPKVLQEYIESIDERNTLLSLPLDSVKGVSTEKVFIDTKANMNGVSLDSYKIVRENVFAYVPDTSRRGDKIALALNTEKHPILVSSIYTTFKCKDAGGLLPEYLIMFLSRTEFDRYARYHSWGSAREVFSMDDMNGVRIPIPDISIQQDIVNIHKCLLERKRIAESLKALISNICPILVQGSLQINN